MKTVFLHVFFGDCSCLHVLSAGFKSSILGKPNLQRQTQTTPLLKPPPDLYLSASPLSLALYYI